MPKADITMTDYDKPCTIEAPAAYLDNGQGGNANANQWTVVRSPRIGLYSGKNGRGATWRWLYGQRFPEAQHYGEMRYAASIVIDDTMTVVVYGRRYQILGAIDHNLAHKIIVLALVEYQAKGTKAT